MEIKKNDSCTTKYQQIETKDIELFDSMKNRYISDEEELFFKTLHYKEENEIAPSAELLISENSNADTVYFVRYNVCEYKIGSRNELTAEKENYFQTLADALSANLNEIGALKENITMLEWLRRNNYQGINYNRNFGYE